MKYHLLLAIWLLSKFNLDSSLINRNFINNVLFLTGMMKVAMMAKKMMMMRKMTMEPKKKPRKPKMSMKRRKRIGAVMSPNLHPKRILILL